MTIVIKSSEDIDVIRKAIQKLRQSGKLNAHKHCGQISLSNDPIEIQKRMRNEW